VPLYEYQCVKCHRRTEKIESVAGPHIRKCPHCGGKLERLVTAPAIQFKGSGWYVTDYAGKSGSKDSAVDSAGEAKSAEKGTSNEGASKESKETKDTKEAKEKKSSKKKE